MASRKHCGSLVCDNSSQSFISVNDKDFNKKIIENRKHRLDFSVSKCSVDNERLGLWCGVIMKIPL